MSSSSPPVPQFILDFHHGLLELVDSEIFHVADLDIKMLPMDGVALLKEIRKRSPETRVIMTTAYPTVESRDECIKFGASAYLVKPVEISKLNDLLWSWCNTETALQ